MDQEEKQRNYEKAEILLSEQNFAAAVIAGAVATVLAAAIYGIVVARWSFSYGFAAAGIGIAIGISMQYLGRGIEMKFAVAAAAYTLVQAASSATYSGSYHHLTFSGVMISR
jgi:dipeptide/tripeptide permease